MLKKILKFDVLFENINSWLEIILRNDGESMTKENVDKFNVLVRENETWLQVARHGKNHMPNKIRRITLFFEDIDKVLTDYYNINHIYLEEWDKNELENVIMSISFYDNLINTRSLIEEIW